MVNITKETREENDIEAIVDKYGDLWLNKKHLEKKWDIQIYQLLQRNMTQCIKNVDLN